MSMEEVWRDISLTILHQDIPSTPSLSHHHRTNISNQRHHQRHEAAKSSRSLRGIILQDFLSGTLKEASSVVPLPDTPHPATALSLNFGHFFGAHGSVPTRSVPFFAGAHSDASDGFPPPAAGLAACCAEKRPPEQQTDVGFGDSVDRRKKRMMKNRESAARSRARKQAYTYEIELEVAQLVKENRKLKRQCEELRAAMAAQESATTKSKLQRSSSATF